MQIKQLLERIGNPVSLHVAWGFADTRTMVLEEQKVELVDVLLQHLRPMIRVECEPIEAESPRYRIQADIVAMSRDEFAKVMMAAYRVGRHDIGPAEDVA